MLANVLSNAIKFTDKGEVVIKVAVEPVIEEKDVAERRERFHVTVQDTGIGISGESMKKLFQSFRQGHESMSRKYGGTGLGLAISRRLAELMGGTIWVESAVGLGSIFHFTMMLPWARDGDAESVSSADFLMSGSGGVDDNSETRSNRCVP